MNYSHLRSEGFLTQTNLILFVRYLYIFYKSSLINFGYVNTAVGIDKTFNGIFTASVEAGIKKYVKNDFKTGVKVNRQAFDSSSKFLDTMGYVNAGLILNLNDDTTYGLYYQGIGGKDNFSHTVLWKVNYLW